MNIQVRKQKYKLLKEIFAFILAVIGYFILVRCTNWKVTAAIAILFAAEIIRQESKPKSVTMNMIESKQRYPEGK